MEEIEDKNKGIVLTPPHITEFFSDLAQVNKNSIVYDSCTGAGGFLIKAMIKMVNDAKGDETKINEIKSTQLMGTEYDSKMFSLVCNNMALYDVDDIFIKNNILNGDCFDEDIIATIKEKKPTVGFLNPPYKSEKGDKEELEFVLNNLKCLEKHSQCVAIVPMSCALAQSGERLRLKEELLSKHTLKAVFSMPNELFKNSKVAVGTCIMVFEAHIPHPEKKKSFFGYFKDDGFLNKKTKGRFDYNKKWEDIKDHWLSLYFNNEEELSLSITRKVTAHDEWCVEAYMETDYSKLTKDDFEKCLKEYVAFQVVNGTIDSRQ